MKKLLSVTSILLILIMLLGTFASCTGGQPEQEQSSESSSQEGGDESTESKEETGSRDDEETQSPGGNGGSNVVDSEDDADQIKNANDLANKVNSFYSDVDRTNYVISNENMILNYNTAGDGPKLVTSLTDKNGNAYIENTMDVFVRMKDGKSYYSSGSIVNASTNIYRLGYYYYESRIENQVFFDISDESAGHTDIALNYDDAASRDVTVLEREKERIKFRIDNRRDPSVVIKNVKFNTADYKYLQIILKAGSGVGANGELFIKAGGSSNFSDDQRIEFSVSSDGQYHTYTIPLANVKNYTGRVTGIRIDINGAPGSEFEISSIKAFSMGENAPDTLSLNRSFHTYSDKLHQVIQVAATEDTEVSVVGIQTKIDASTVEAILIRDRGGLHYGTDGIAWATVNYVGFIIKGVGVFGYIMPYDRSGGTLRVSLSEDGTQYIIEQTLAPDGKEIIPSKEGTGNANDVYMGSRIYTDTEKNFDKFIIEAECEIDPLGEENFSVNALKSGAARFVGYDPLRGCYRFDVDAAAGFRGPFAEYPNRHFGVQFTVKGDDKDRQIYVMTYCNQGSLECAAVLDEQSMMLPIPVEVSKNFKGDGENTIFMKDDAQYGETFIPLIVEAQSEDTFSILNLYQNWGNFPLKQISSIQYFGPYYHLSVGTTETNCLVPYGSGGLSLPDFRTMSAPIWSEINPQHNSCGSHSFIRYTDSEGVFISNQITGTCIDSYGPTYADMSIEFISDDGKVKITYSHMEQPHTDENRSFFTLSIEVLEDVSIKNFKEDFYFYSVRPNDPTGVYQRVGYLDTNNASQVAAANKSDSVVEYVLGDTAPYFSFFDMDDYSAAFNNNLDCTGSGYANVAMIIGSSEFIIEGEKCNAPFVLRDMSGSLRLSLDLGETTLKAGDSLTIDGILMPWGSQEMEGSYDEIQDQNVRDVREDSILKPLVASAVENCVTVHKSKGAFLPELKSTNGKSATFTLSGGANNNAVRIYGFDMLTVPVVEELVGDTWKVYELASINNRDRLGYGYQYDGYNVYYDEDGTYSYSFVVNMDDTEGRTFRITADTEFKGWGAEEDPTEDLPMNFYITPENMAPLGATLGTLYGCDVEFVTENDEKFFRFFGADHQEGYLIPYNQSPLYPTTGQYFVFKYRIPTANKSNFTYFDVFASTSETWFTAPGVNLRASGCVKKDGDWHTIIIDLSAITTYTPNQKGEYIAKFLRVDVMNSSGDIPATDYIDIAYFGLSDDIQKVLDISGDENYVSFFHEGLTKKIDTKTGEISEDKDPINYYYDPIEMGSMITISCSSELSADKSYRRYFANGGSEGQVFVYRNGNGSNVTGQYLVFKYRVPDGVNMATNFEIFAGTSEPEPVAGGSTSVSLVKSNEWQILIVDLSKISGFNAVEGVYKAKHVRLDVINGKFTHTDDAPAYIDVEYFGLHDSLEGIFEINGEANYVTVVNNTGYSEKYYNTENGFVAESEMGDDGGIRVELTPELLPNPSGANLELAEDGSYGRFYAKGAGEAHISVYKNPSQKTTGKYFFVKFRIPVGANMPTNFQIYSSTQNGAAADNNGNDNILVGSILPADGWQLLVVDLTQITTFTKSNDKYAAKYLRFDLINGNHTHTEDVPAYIDIAVVGIHDSLVEILEANSDIAVVQFADGNGKQTKLNNDGSVEEPVEKEVIELPDLLNVYQYPYELEDLRVRGLNKVVAADGSYITFSANNASEGSVFAYENSAGNKATGQYFVLKYRVPSTVTDMANNIEIFASTTNGTETAGDNIQIGNFISDGNWHVMVIDLSKIATFNENNGEYYAKYIRLDIINGKYTSDTSVDVAYVGLHDNLDEICALNADMESIWYVNAQGAGSSLTTNAE